MFSEVRVSHSVYRREGVSLQTETPWTETPSGQRHSWIETSSTYLHLVAATEAGGTHPTGMHTCFNYQIEYLGRHQK